MEEIPVDTSLLEQLVGKIANIDTLFPVWDNAVIAEEKWTEPLNAETAKKIKYPKNLKVANEVSVTTFFGLEPIEVAVDPKAKKEAKKDPKKGSVEAPVALTEVLVDEHGRALPVVFKERGSTVNPEVTGAERNNNDNKSSNEPEYLGFDTPRTFLCTCAADGPSSTEVDPFICGAYRIIQRFVPTILKAHISCLAVVSEAVSGAEKGIEEERHILDDTYLWRAIYPKLPTGKPCYNPAGKYCVRLYLAGSWRRVYVNDTVPVHEDGTPAVACSVDKYEIWPMLLAKAIYTVYSACG